MRGKVGNQDMCGTRAAKVMQYEGMIQKHPDVVEAFPLRMLTIFAGPSPITVDIVLLLLAGRCYY
jgi:hypothetical protein